MSADPAIFTLVSPMDDKGNLRSGFNLFESMYPYSYVGNNPLKFKDPSGLVSVVGEYDGEIVTETEMTDSKYFSQLDFTDPTGQKLGWEFDEKTACAATSLLNELSTEYTSITGDALSLDKAETMMGAAIDAGMIDGKDAYVKDWSGAANAMWGTLNLYGEWSFSDKGFHTILAWDKTGSGKVNHFVNELPGGLLANDVWDNSIIDATQLPLATKGLGEYRILNFKY